MTHPASPAPQTVSTFSEPTSHVADHTGRSPAIPNHTEWCSESSSKDLNARVGVLPDCVLIQNHTWCEKHDRSSCRCRRIASAQERTRVLREIGAFLQSAGNPEC